MATQTTNLGLTLPIGSEKVSRQIINQNNQLIDDFAGQTTSNFTTVNTAIGTLNDKLANIPKVVYNLDIINGQSIFDTAAAFAAAHKGEANIVGRFYLSASYIPSDLPANTNAEKYGYGEIDIRVSPNSGSFDGKIFLYGFNSNLLYVKDISNGTAGSWQQLALKSDISSKFETWTGGTKQLAADGQTWLCGAQQIVSASAEDASAAICLFSKTGSYYRLSPIVKSSNAAFIYNQNGVFGVQFDNSYNNSAMFAIRLI